MTEYNLPIQGARLELSYLHGGEIINQAGEVLGPRVLADFELVYIIEGGVAYVSDGETHAVSSGGFVLGRPGFEEVYRWDAQKPTRHAYFHFGIDVYPVDWSKLDEWPRTRNALGPLGANLLHHILQCAYEHDSGSSGKPGPTACRLVETLIDTFLNDHRADLTSFERKRPEPVRRALLLLRKVVEEDPKRALSLAEVAAYAHVTEKHLCRLFSGSLGHSPMQTFSLLKLQSSRPLLVRTNLSVKEVAERCGFENPLYFSRRFSKVFGCSPSAYRDRQESGRPASLKNILPADLMPRTRW